MSTEKKHAEELIQFVEMLRNSQNSYRLPRPDPMDAVMVEDLMRIAKMIKPDPSFVQGLRKHLLQVSMTERQRAVGFLRSLPSRWMRIWNRSMVKQKRLLQTMGLAALLILSALVVVPALASRFGLGYFAPQEVEKLPSSGGPVVLATIPSEAYSKNIKMLEERAGFSVLVPRYLPFTCNLRGGYYLAEPIGEIHLEYDSNDNLPCFDVAQRKRKTQEDTVHSPFVGQGSVEEITIKGKPALYINGVWMVKESLSENGTTMRLSPEEREKLFGGATWVQGPQQLIFEYKGLLIHINAGPNISKEELVKIAESME